MAFNRSRLLHAFTLVELLVVIGIIAILIGILLPVLSSARRQGNLVKCQSALRQIGYAFTMYSKENRGRYPALKWSPAGTTDPLLSLYWNDFLLPYLARGVGTNSQNLSAGGGGAANDSLQRAKQSIMWSCPDWFGSYAQNSTPITWIDKDGKSIFETGFCYNAMPYLGPGSVPANSGSQQVTTGSGSTGVYYMYTKWAPYGDRCLVTEANLWFMWFVPADPNNHIVLPQPADRDSQVPADTIASTAHPGWNNVDRYRHGKYPRQITAPWGAGRAYDDKDPRGAVKCNILYADGHVTAALSMKEIYHSFFLRDP